MNKHSLLKILVVALVAILLLPGAALAQDSTPVTLMHGWTGADNTEMLNTVFDRFNMDNENGLVIEPTALGWDDLFTQLTLTAAAGNPPDVVMFHNTEVTEFVRKGVLLPVDALMAAAGIDLTGVPQNIIELSKIDGEFYCLPGDLHPMNLYYNVDLVEAAGLDPDSPPTTGEEFLAWAEAMTLTDDNGVVTQYGLDMPYGGGLGRWFFHTLLYQFGGDYLGEDGLSVVNSEAGQRALQWLVDAHATGWTTRGTGFGDISAFDAGRGGMILSGPWMVNSYITRGMNIGTAVMPTMGDIPATWTNTHCLALTVQDSDANYLNSMKVVKWFLENYAEPGIKVGIVPVLPVALADPYWTDHDYAQYYAPFVESLSISIMEPAIEKYTSVFSFSGQSPLLRNLEAALAGDKSVEDALNDMKEGIDELLLDE
jgi:multiple sugar transport system substrate-binding protein